LHRGMAPTTRLPGIRSDEMSYTSVIRVALVEPHRLIRDALHALLEQTPGMTVVGEADTVEKLLQVVENRRPDVVLLVMNGWGEREVTLLEALPGLSERTRALVITADLDPNLHARAIQLGAMGIVLKTQTAPTLVKAVQKVHAGELWLDRSQTADLVNRLTRKRTAEDPEAAKVGTLTAREREIVTLVSEGLKNKDIAERLSISEATARNHLTSILDKLALTNRFQLAVYAFRKGLVACPQTPAMLRSAGASRQDPYPRTQTRSRRRHSA
jgi:two-component system, NarL family, nitrate/nitrite response regulator NarL